MTIPDFDENGCLPPGEHAMTWDEFDETFAYNESRRMLLFNLKAFVDEFCKGCRFFAAIGGSYVTGKEHPNDIDVALNFSHEQPSLYERQQAKRIVESRDQIKKPYRLDAFFGVAWTETFKRFRPSVLNLQAKPSNHKGIVKIDL